jgi:hypothetical protein
VIANNGLIDGSGRIVGSLSNTSTGEIRVGASDRLVFSGADGNNGTFSLYGGTMEFTDPLGNFPTGRIVGRGVINARGGISNDGTISFSAGFTDVSGGSLSNNNGSKVIITGGSTSTFYGAVTNNAGSEFRVSTASTAVFLGTVTGLGAFTGSGIKDFEGAALAGPLVTSGSSIVEAPSVLTAQYIREAALTVNGRASIVPNGTAASVSRLNVLNISGGKFDLADNDLVIDSTSLATIQSLIKSGFSGGSWSGQGLTSSTAQSIAADNANPHKTALGYASASSIGVTTFDGQSVGGSSVLVRYTWSGDANLDGKVNALDFNALASNFGGASNKLWNEGDFNYDGTVNTADFNALASNFNLALPAPALGTLVPEPMLMALAAPSLLVLARRRRY